MDTLQAQHAFDQIEMHLSEIKENVLTYSSSPEKINELESTISELEDELSDKEEEVENLGLGISSAIDSLENIKINCDDPTEEMINEVIEILKDLI